MQYQLDIFSGADYQNDRDNKRLTGQLLKIYDIIKDGNWRTLNQISYEARAPEASVSAQLRNLRKKPFEKNIERRHIKNGLYEYRLGPGKNPDPAERCWY
jgi:hypothetical protein